MLFIQTTQEKAGNQATGATSERKHASGEERGKTKAAPKGNASESSRDSFAFCCLIG